MPVQNLRNLDKILQSVLAGEKLGPHEKDLSELFEFIATKLLCDSPSRKAHYFDGVVRLAAIVKTPRKIEFQGEMWVGTGQDQWTESFKAVVTDKRVTKQGIRINLRIGSDQAEGEITSLLQ